MSNVKHYPLHPNQSHPPIMTCEIPLEEYESIKRENAELKEAQRWRKFPNEKPEEWDTVIVRIVMDAVRELVNDRKKLLADKRTLMLEVKQLKERLSTPASPPGADASPTL